eukprot:TRINITY_DN15583_c0_g2_i1.p1 TRINITY_DN15583_c0_g2~~TRINITY_DN15583_c0_g2_i1.p1  ORF type:complete len:659 (+),score=140.31 TRINITY_DN15583_c0_g2_i1:97-2073(+)
MAILVDRGNGATHSASPNEGAGKHVGSSKRAKKPVDIAAGKRHYPEIYYLGEQAKKCPLPPGWSSHERKGKKTFTHDFGALPERAKHPLMSYFEGFVSLAMAARAVGKDAKADIMEELAELRLQLELEAAQVSEAWIRNDDTSPVSWSVPERGWTTAVEPTAASSYLLRVLREFQALLLEDRPPDTSEDVLCMEGASCQTPSTVLRRSPLQPRQAASDVRQRRRLSPPRREASFKKQQTAGSISNASSPQQQPGLVTDWPTLSLEGETPMLSTQLLSSATAQLQPLSSLGLQSQEAHSSRFDWTLPVASAATASRSFGGHTTTPQQTGALGRCPPTRFDWSQPVAAAALTSCRSTTPHDVFVIGTPSSLTSSWMHSPAFSAIGSSAVPVRARDAEERGSPASPQGRGAVGDTPAAPIFFSPCSDNGCADSEVPQSFAAPEGHRRAQRMVCNRQASDLSTPVVLTPAMPSHALQDSSSPRQAADHFVLSSSPSTATPGSRESCWSDGCNWAAVTHAAPPPSAASPIWYTMSSPARNLLPCGTIAELELHPSPAAGSAAASEAASGHHSDLEAAYRQDWSMGMAAEQGPASFVACGPARSAVAGPASYSGRSPSALQYEALLEEPRRALDFELTPQDSLANRLQSSHSTPPAAVLLPSYS